jgi:N-acetylmuramoyl-L-alanine amidase
MARRRAHPPRYARIALAVIALALLMAPLAGSLAAPSAYQPATQEVVVTTGVLNVRSGAGLGYPVTRSVLRGEVYRTAGEHTPADGYTWSTLLTADHATLGWVADQYLSMDVAGDAGGSVDVAGAFAVGGRVVVTTDLNFRTGPGTGSSVMRALRTGSVLTLTDGPVAASGYIWYQGRTTQATGSETGWVIQDGLAAADAELPDPGLAYESGAIVHVASGGLRLRVEPATSAGVVSQLSAGTTLTVTGLPVGASGYSWYPVTCPWGATGWVAGDYLAYGAGSGAAAPAPVTGTTPAPEAGSATVDTPRLNLRAGAGTDRAVVGILTGGTSVVILEGPLPATGYTWYRVETPGGATGWVIGEALAW